MRLLSLFGVFFLSQNPQVVFGDQLCFDTSCFTLSSGTIEPDLLAECACGFFLTGVKNLSQITQFDPETCAAEFANEDGSKIIQVQLRAPNYPVSPVVLEDDARGGVSGNYGSINVFQDSCNVSAGKNMWLADGDGRKFVWDLGMLYKLSRMEFRNSRNFDRNSRYVKEFKVAVSRYYGDKEQWVEVVHAENLDHPSLCDPIRRYTFNSTIARYVKFTAVKTYNAGAAVHYFRVY